MEAFHTALNDCWLMDVGYSRMWFTWERGNLPKTNIKEWLDRGLQMIIGFRLRHDGHWRKCLKRRSRISEGLRQCLTCWASKISKGREGLKRDLRRKLESLLEKERTKDNRVEIIDTKLYLNLEIEKDEVYWEQRAHANWLNLGDKNITFFHNSASQRKRANTIKCLRDKEGRDKLFTTEGSSNMDKVFSGIEQCVSLKENLMLATTYTKDEIREAIKRMGPTKAPGDDGFSAIFFQKYWHIVGLEVTSFCLKILNADGDLKDLNVTNIVLIPHIPQIWPTFMIAKVVANRFQHVLDGCIDSVESAFVPGCLITDNVLVA
ncbi:reverse transcriptase [Gossypium australe]|uniref:Reverse transcriptase n=1 Tax=Gossypium australe TaxID=47621 RepID=A0A5B6WSB0_9ROSI|nr:reverse transcriptase [Gossypium australe]